MRIRITGEGKSASALRGYFHATDYHVTEHQPYFTIHCTEGWRRRVVIDGCDSELERCIINHVADQLEKIGSGVNVELAREGGIKDDRAIHVTFPTDDKIAAAVELGVFVGVEEAKKGEAGKEKVKPRRKDMLPWWRRLLPLLLLVGLVHGQTTTPTTAGSGGGGGGDVTIVDPTTPTQKAGVNASGELKVACSGCSAAPNVSIADGTTPTQKAAVGAAGAIKINLAEYLGAAIGASNAVHVQPGTGANFTVNWSGQTVTVTQGTGSNLHVVVDSAPSTAVTGTFWPTTAGAPSSTRLSDGTSFYDAVKTGQLPASLVGGRLDANVGAWLGSTAPTVGQKTSANSIPTVLASDQSPVPINEQAATSGGCTIASTVSAATTNATSTKASAGQVYSVTVTNTNAAVRYFKLYNKASAPTVGTDVPVFRVAIPASTTGGGIVVPVDVGMVFATGIAWALTTGAADSDSGAVAANELLVNICYK